MRPRSRRGFMATGVAATAVVALLGGVVVAGASPDLPHHGPYGVGEPPPVDGGRADVAEDRFEVTLDAAVVVAAAAVDRVEDDVQGVSQPALVAPGRVSEGTGLSQGGAGEAGAGNDGAATPSLEVVIGSDSPPSPDEVARALASMDERVESVTHVIGNVYQVTGRDLDVERVGALPGVVSAEVEGIAHPTGDPHLPLQWGLENTGRTFGGIVGTPGLDIGFAESSQVATGTGVVVAVVDSGIQTDHPDLSGRFWRNDGEICGNGADDDRNGHVDDCHGWDFVHHDASVYDPQGDNAHGTHVAGIVAATTSNGIGVASLAPGATIMPVKVFDGGSAPVTRVAAAIQYAVDNGADVINLSLGGDPSPSLALALDAAAAADVLVVAAAGNDGRDIDAQPTYPASYPHANMVTVGSHAADGRVSSFSNTGVVSVDVFAPGQTIAATYPGSSYVYMSGTSMAAPMVSAMAAVIAQNRATTSAAVLHRAVLDAVVTGGAYLGRSVTGGRVHAPLALGEPNVDPGDVAATFTGLVDLEPGTVSSTITAGLDDAVADGVDLELLLARWHDGAPHAVVGHDATVAVDGDSRVAATDGEGRLVLELTDAARSRLADGALRIDVATDLPAGQYALAVLPVADDGAARRPTAAFFVVNDPAPVPGEQPAPEPGDDPSPEPDEGDSPAPAPAPEEPAPGDGTDPEPDPGPAPAPTPAPAPAPAPGPDPVPTPDPPPTPDREPAPGQPSPPDDGAAPGPGDDTTPPPPPAPAPDPAPDDTAPDPGSGPAPEPSPDPDDDHTPPPPGDGPAPAPDDGDTPAPDGGDDPSQPEPPVWPTSGPSDGGTWVNVKGAFDPAGTYYVHIGSQILVPRVVMSSVLQVVTTASSAQGPQDVVVHGPGGALIARHPAAFTFLHDGSAAPPPDAGGTPSPGDGPTPAPDDGPTPGPAPDDGPPPPSDDDPAPAPDDGPAPSPDDGSAPDPGDGDGPSRTPWTAGSPFTLPDGLTLDRIVSGPLAGLTADAWTRAACLSDPCDGVLVR